MVVCLVLHLSMPRVSAHARHMEEKMCFCNLLYTCQLSLFRPIIEYYIMDKHIHMAMCIPNPVYNSLDVRYTILSYNYKYRERYDVGACCNIALGVGCNTYSEADSVHVWGESCKL